MKRLYLSIITAGLLLVMPAFAYAGDAPPVGQALVREGDYAVELVKALNINAAQSEADAENALATLGIAPQTGWISDFPVTPDIITQVQDSVDEAVSAGRLAMSREAAEKALIAMNERLGLAVTPAREGEYYEQMEADQSAVDGYYADEGPPVITYYSPPSDYAYLYAWDPYPFWYGGYWFPGYFILNDFDIDIDHQRHRRVGENDMGDHFFSHRRVSNHIVVPESGKILALDPVSRHPLSRTEFRPVGARSFEPVARSTGGVVRSGEVNAGRSTVRINGGTFDRESASRLVNQGPGRTTGFSESIANTRAVGRNLPESMCSIGNCSPRSTGSRGYSSEGISTGSYSSGGGGNGGSRGYVSEGRSSGSGSYGRGGSESRSFSSEGRSSGSGSYGRGGGESRGYSGGRSSGGGFSGGHSSGGGFGGGGFSGGHGGGRR